MNVFYLHPDPKTSARLHCDKHVVKMIIEYAQQLCTAHRVLDGVEYYDKSKNGRKIKRYMMENSALESVLYKASHINHPDNVWVRQSVDNYNYLYRMFVFLCEEYTWRYGKIHETERKLRRILHTSPKNIPEVGFTEPPQAMPDYCKNKNVVEAYRCYYRDEKKDFAKWTKRPVPEFMKAA